MSSFRLKIDPRSRAAGRFMLAVRTALQKAFAEEEAERGLSRSEMAKALGIHRSAITRRLAGSEGLTMRTIADLAWAMGREPELVLHKPTEKHGANEVRVSSEPPEDLIKSGGGGYGETCSGLVILTVEGGAG